ncbi:MAG TPA: DUF885 domain-containing protein [Gemmatimonadaceae bacterium]|nr:DUF885 domain-containing protein [Gemmatimonadaceae bacterium]
MISRLAALALGSAVISAPSAAAQSAPARPDFHQRFVRLASHATLTDSARLAELFALDWEYVNVESPETATYTGYPGQDDRWTDNSFAVLARRRREMPDRLLVLKAIDRRRLNASDRLSYDIFKRSTEESIDGRRFPSELLAVSQRSGPQFLASVLSKMPSSSAADYDRILARLAALPTVIEQTRALLDSGLAVGVTSPRVTLRDVPAQLERLVPEDAMKSALLEPFTRLPSAMSASDRARLVADASRVYAERVRPAYLRLASYLTATYIPRSRESIAWSSLPDGRAWYAHEVKLETTTSRTPAEIHALGLAEVKRIRAQMDSAIRASGHAGDFESFVTMLRTDERFFMKDSASLVRGYRDIAKRIDPELARLFGKLPRLTYGVTTVPSYAAPSQTTAYYMSGSPDAHRPGMFFVNTYKLDSRPTWEMEALTAHEAVPGHHLQIALSQELQELPGFRRYSGYTAFTEGWALYAESLGPELGLYRDPYSKFGQLTYEMWRAIRLVLDTGIHEFGWTREQAIEYFTANSAKTEQDIRSEVDRYIVMPAQALAYKSGELAIRAIRQRAERELGAGFDIRAFHDELLSEGALPLDVLESRMGEWVRKGR